MDSNPFNEKEGNEAESNINNTLINHLEFALKGDILTSLNLDLNSKIEVLWNITYANGEEKAVWWKCKIVQKLQNTFYAFDDIEKCPIYEVLYEKKEPFFNSEEKAQICFLSGTTVFDVNEGSELLWRRCDNKLSLIEIFATNSVEQLQSFLQKFSSKYVTTDELRLQIERQVETVIHSCLDINFDNLNHMQKVAIREKVRKMKELVCEMLLERVIQRGTDTVPEITVEDINEVITDIKSRAQSN